jgi:hypothetical protein
MDFIDIPGASGTRYRFRRWPETGSPPPIAGNYAVVDLTTHAVVEHGVMDDLSRAQTEVASHGSGTAIFTRYNVARANREAEHADIAQQHPHLTG